LILKLYSLQPPPRLPLSTKKRRVQAKRPKNAFPCGADLGKIMLLYFDAWNESLMLLYLLGKVRSEVSGRYLILHAPLLIY